jgi:hypothetical protein
LYSLQEVREDPGVQVVREEDFQEEEALLVEEAPREDGKILYFFGCLITPFTEKRLSLSIFQPLNKLNYLS